MVLHRDDLVRSGATFKNGTQTVFEIKVTEIQDATIIELAGVFGDREHAEALLKAVTDKLDEGRRKFLVHCGKVRYMNRNGVEALVKVHLAVTQASARVAYCGSSKIFLILSGVYKPLREAHTHDCKDALEALLAVD